MILRFIYSAVLSVVSVSSIAGSVDSGEQAYERCALCHGLYGVSPRSRFPILAGQNPVYLENQIRSFLNGTRTNDGGQMQGVVAEITEDQIAEVVTWFSTQERVVSATGKNHEGQAYYLSIECASCHFENQSAEELVPLLFAQHKDYLAKQMRELRDGVRITEYEKELHQNLVGVTDKDIDLIAGYLASQERR